jgi:D-aminopeptidase
MLCASLLTLGLTGREQPKPRARELGIVVGTIPTGPLNAITDVAGVMVGHYTLDDGKDVHTGATAILPRGGNEYNSKVTAAVYVANGYGKLMGSTQIRELGEIETPIVLTNTLCVPRAADAILDYVLARTDQSARSINPIVGETNDGLLNDVRRRALTREMILTSITAASAGPVQEGSVGAGRGTVCFGYKGGIGTSSRVIESVVSNVTGTVSRTEYRYTVGVLVQTNYGGALDILGVPIDEYESKPSDGSCMIIVATDAPLESAKLERLAKRAVLALGRTGSYMSNGSGDYVIAFSTRPPAPSLVEGPLGGSGSSRDPLVLNRLFEAVVDATEEAIYNSLFMADPIEGYRGSVEALDVDSVLAKLRRAGRIGG